MLMLRGPSASAAGLVTLGAGSVVAIGALELLTDMGEKKHIAVIKAGVTKCLVKNDTSKFAGNVNGAIEMFLKETPHTPEKEGKIQKCDHHTQQLYDSIHQIHEMLRKVEGQWEVEDALLFLVWVKAAETYLIALHVQQDLGSSQKKFQMLGWERSGVISSKTWRG